MQGEPPTKARTSSGAVFLSYASQDGRPAQRICEALRAAGIEVWFDQSELRGGDAWDQKIRRQIRECALFLPVISAHSQERLEGYFRLEWKLAVDRSHLMATERPFLVPVVIDATSDADALVPDRFREVQWTQLPGGETPPAFVERVQRLLSTEASSAIRAGATSRATRTSTAPPSPASGWLRRWQPLCAAVVVLGVVGYLTIEKPWISKPAGASPATAVATPAFNPPPHSIAVLPFVNMSGDKDQEYFSEGLSEQLLNDLSRINELQVAARTSAFSFKGKDTDIGTIARKLNVSAVLEGSVRRSDQTIRVTAQLINSVTGFHLWSETYDRPLGDVLKLQTEIATAVTDALKVTLLGDISQRIELGGTQNPAAFDAYLRGRTIGHTASGGEEHQRAIAAYTEAIRLDPRYALAFVERSLELSNHADFDIPDPAAAHEVFERALADARTATGLAPELADGYYALGVALKLGSLDFAPADVAYKRALALAPGSARILAAYSRHAAENGDAEAAINSGRRAVALDPLNFHVHRGVGIALLVAHQYTGALASFQTAISLQPDYLRNYVLLGETQYALGAYEAARKSCESAPADPLGHKCLAMTYRKLGRNNDAEVMLQKLKSEEGDAGACDYAGVYAQWGEVSKALDWLETAVRLRTPGLEELKSDRQFDPLRKEPRFRAIESALRPPN